MNENKTLYKTDKGSVLGGVCKGISEVYDMDVSLVRLIAVLLLFVAGAPFIIYIIMWIVLPDKKDVIIKYNDPHDEYTVDNEEYTVDNDEYYY
jgi:phage shock protein PspC (stress-responsive transcriptional regulator)